MKQPFSTNLSANISMLQNTFAPSSDFYVRRIRIQNVNGAILMFEGITSLNVLWDIFLDALSRSTPFQDTSCNNYTGEQLLNILLTHSDLPTENQPTEDLQTAIDKLTAGMALLFIDGCDKALAISVQNMQFRSVSEPIAEGNLRGSREGFCDLLRVNISLIRRLIRTSQLVIETSLSDSEMRTEYALCYHREKVDPTMLAKLKHILTNAKPELLLDSSYYAPWICPVKYRLFTPLGYTQRPAVAAAKICEGKIILLVNGSPSVMIVPYLFAENFDCLDDYGGTAYFASFIRMLKYFAFYLTILLPGLFAACSLYAPELIPPALLYKIAAAEKATPLPLFAEMLLVIILLEVIREAGLRMPQSLGHSVSLVAALIVGDTAISTGILSTSCIIVASITSIAMFLVPSLYEPATMLRILFLIAGGLTGPVGIAFGLVALICAMADTRVFDVNYTSQILPLSSNAFRDGLLRQNYRRLSRPKHNKRGE